MRSMVSLHLGSKHTTGTLGPETQSPQTLGLRQVKKRHHRPVTEPGRCNEENAPSNARDALALSKGDRSGTAQQRLERPLPLNQSCPELQKENVSFIHKGT